MIGVSIAPPAPTETGRINNRRCREEAREEMRTSRRRETGKRERRGVKRPAGGRPTKKGKEEGIKIMEEGRWEAAAERHGADRSTTTDARIWVEEETTI